MSELEKRFNEKRVESIINQSAAMSKIADGYDVSKEEKEIIRKCLKGEMDWDEGYKKIMSLPISTEA